MVLILLAKQKKTNSIRNAFIYLRAFFLFIIFLLIYLNLFVRLHTTQYNYKKI